jgi:PAS domain S-box-containing protein
MQVQISLPVLALLLVAMMSPALALYGWRRRPPRGLIPFITLLLTLTVWSLGYALELGGVGLPTKVFWAQFEYLGIVFIPVAWLAFALQFVGSGEWLTRRKIASLLIVPLVTLVLVWTNGLHHFYWVNVATQQHGTFVTLAPTYGIAFWVFAVFSYVLLLVGTGFLIRALFQSPDHYRGQMAWMLTAALLPWVGNALLLTGLSPLPGVDLAPFAFSLSTVAAAWGLFRFRLLELLPVARGAVVEHLQDGVLVVDSQDRVLDLNPAAVRIFGIPSQRVIGQPLDALLPNRPDVVARFREAMEVGASAEFTLGGGRARQYFDLQISPLYNRRHRLSGWIFQMRDITKRKIVEAELERTGEQYRQLVEQSSDVVYTIDSEGHFTYVSQPAQKLTGYPGNQLVGVHFTKLILPAWRERVQEFYEEQRDKQEEALFQFPIVTGFGQVKWVEQVVTVLREDDKVTGFQSAMRDITERKKAEEAESERRAIAEALSDIAAALNSTQDLEEVLNRILANAGRVVPHDTANIMLIDQATGIAHIVRNEGREEYGQSERMASAQFPVKEFANLRHMLETGEPFAISDTRRYPDWQSTPETDWIRSWAGAPIRQEGKVTGFLNLDSATPRFFDDEHAQRLLAFADQAAVALTNARLFADLAERNDELDAFSHTIAHDLKAPLNNILGFVVLILLNEDFPEAERENLQIVQDQAKLMGAMIDKLLRLATLRDASEAAIQVDMDEVARQAVARFRTQSKEQDVTIMVAPDLPPAMGHAPWLEEVFANLIGNAIKYIGKDNPDPRIIVRGVLRDHHVRYEVTDNGLGIEPEQQEQLFEMFSRFHKQEASGLGLGLSIVQRIVTKLNGEVGVTSEPGRGSTFWFELPTPEAGLDV